MLSCGRFGFGRLGRLHVMMVVMPQAFASIRVLPLHGITLAAPRAFARNNCSGKYVFLYLALVFASNAVAHTCCRQAAGICTKLWW